MMLALALLAWFAARATEPGLPVLYADPAVAVLRRASRDLALPPRRLELYPLDGLLGGMGPRVLGAAVAPPCPGPPVSNEALRRSAERSLDLLRYGKSAEARRELERAIGGFACLGETLEASLAARLLVLLGVSAGGGGDASGAEAAFCRARDFAPGLSWDADLGEMPAAFACPARGEEAAELLVPPAGAGVIWVDGRPAGPAWGALSLRPGPHVVQVLYPALWTLELTLEPGRSATLVVPGALDAHALSGELERPAVRRYTAALAVAAFPEADAIFLSGLDTTWRLEARDRGWSRLARGGPRFMNPVAGAAMMAAGALAAGLGAERLVCWRTGGRCDKTGQDVLAIRAAWRAVFGAGLAVGSAGGLFLVVGLQTPRGGRAVRNLGEPPGPEGEER